MNRDLVIAGGVAVAAVLVWWFWPRRDPPSIIAGDIVIEPSPEDEADAMIPSRPEGTMTMGEPEITYGEDPLDPDSSIHDDLLKVSG